MPFVCHSWLNTFTHPPTLNLLLSLSEFLLVPAMLIEYWPYSGIEVSLDYYRKILYRDGWRNYVQNIIPQHNKFVFLGIKSEGNIPRVFTFLCRCFARLQRETSRNFLVTRFMEEMSYVFSFTFFSLPLTFTLHWWPLAFLILSPPLQNCHVVLSL